MWMSFKIVWVSDSTQKMVFQNDHKHYNFNQIYALTIKIRKSVIKNENIVKITESWVLF